MKCSLIFVMVALTGCIGGCASRSHDVSNEQSQLQPVDSVQRGYDDRLIARIQRGETSEAQLREWFGSPESREVRADGRARLVWTFLRRTDGGPGFGGMLSVSLAPDGKVETYAARGGSLEENRTVEFVEKTDADVREHFEQWRQEGWNVLSISAKLLQADGTVRRKAELSRSHGTTTSRLGYDDSQIAKIRRGTTTDSQLLQWFGPAYSRSVQADGRVELAWVMPSRGGGASSRPGELRASVTPDGTVSAYNAHQGPE